MVEINNANSNHKFPPLFPPTCLHIHWERLEDHSDEGNVPIKRIHHPVLHHCERTNLADGVEKERGGVERGEGREKSKEREVCQVNCITCPNVVTISVCTECNML